MSGIQLENITKKFGTETAVQGANFDIDGDELIVLLGPSGSGKSTTLRMIAGLEDVTSGNIYVGGDEVTDVGPQGRNIAMVFQSFALYPHKSVKGNLAFPLRANGTDSDVIEQKVRSTAETLGIDDLLNRTPSELSGGQQQRVALGRALVRDPDAFLMDEPLANLDANLRKVMRTELVRLQQELGVTMVHVTHNQEEAMTMGDRIAVMHDGELQQIAPPKELYDKPKNRFVAEFIGSPSTNLLEGTIDGDSFLIEDETTEITIPKDLASQLQDGQSVSFGIRPENVLIEDDFSSDTIEAEVEVIEQFGNKQVVYFDLYGDEFLVETDPEVKIVEGTAVNLSFDPNKVLVFDGTTADSERVPRESENRPHRGNVEGTNA